MPKIKDLPMPGDVDGNETIVIEKNGVTGRHSLFGYMRALGYDLKSLVRARLTMNRGLDDPILTLETPTRSITMIDGNGYPVIHTPRGPKPVPDAGRLAMSPGFVDGEPLQRFWRDRARRVIFGYGGMGGAFTLVNGRLERTNGRFFLSKPATPTYAGQAWEDGQQELLSRPTGGSKIAYIFIGMGQSNYDGENQNADDALISAAPIYPGFAKMLEGGPRVWTATGNATLVPLIETIANAGGGADRQRETPTSGWVNHFIRDYHAAWAEYPTVVGMSVAIGGRPYIGNKKGTLAFQRLSIGLANAVEALRAQGFTDIRTVLSWVGSESDNGLARMNGNRFKRQMRQLRRDACDVVRRITGEASDPLLMMIQPSFMQPDTSPWYQPVRQAMVELDGEDGFALAGPAYQYPMTGSAVLADTHIHRNNLGKYSTGQQLARATMAELLGATWRATRPIAARWGNAAGTQIIVECDCMGSALVEDVSGAVSTVGLANKGFLFDDGSGAPPAITSVTLSGQNIVIQLTSRPAGPDCRIGYALLRNADQWDADGPIYGARGTIRDNSEHVRISDGVKQANWLCSFILRLSTP